MMRDKGLVLSPDRSRGERSGDGNLERAISRNLDSTLLVSHLRELGGSGNGA